MTKEEKEQRRIDSRQKRRQKKYDKTYDKYIKGRNDIFYERGFTGLKGRGTWWENGRVVQNCSYDGFGICEFPCNGDC